MFLPTDHSKHVEPLPPNCSFREGDWHIMASFWHPVAFAHDVGNSPVSTVLLDVDLVLFRTDEGVTIANDQCPHRGTRLSMGKVRNGQLICPMHGLHYDHEGRCTDIPSITDKSTPIPTKLCLKTYQSVERYGIVWTCLKSDPIWPLPDWPLLEDSVGGRFLVPPDVWNASAARHVENFNDIAHFPWVHIDSFGGEESESFPIYKVANTDFGLTFTVPYLEGFNRFPDSVDGEKRHVTYTYELTFPFSTLLLVRPTDSEYVHYFADTVCPVSVNKTRIFQLFTDSQGVVDPEFWMKDAETINREDRSIVESQAPFELPLDTREEIHIPADRMSRAYRKSLSDKFGLGLPINKKSS